MKKRVANMSRKTTLLVAVGFCSIGLVFVARAESPATEETLTLTAVKTDRGEAIRVTVGDMAFVVPRLAFQNDKWQSQDITVKDGKLWFPGVGVGSSSGLTGQIALVSEMTIKLHSKSPKK